MEQYFLPKSLDFEHLRFCLATYEPEWLFIRLVGSKGGEVKVDEDLEGRTLDFQHDETGLSLLIDSKEIIHFPLEDYAKEYSKGFTLAYERILPTEDGIGRMVMLSTGINPYDKRLPEPRRSILRHDLDWHLVEISFKGRIHLKFHSWFQEPHWKYWTVMK